MCQSGLVEDLLASLDMGSIELMDRPLYGLTTETLTHAVILVQAVTARLTAVTGAVVHELDGRGIVRQSGAANPAIWLREHVHMSISEAHRVTALGALLGQRPAIHAAIAAGVVTAEQALAIGRVLDELPNACGSAVAEKVETRLIDFAGQFDPAILRRLGDQVLANIAPDLADEQLRKRLEREERQAARDRSLTLSPTGSGRTRLHGVLDTESAAIVRAAIEPLMAPLTGGADQRTVAGRRADALVDVCRLALRTGELPADGGQPAQLNVTIDIFALIERIGDSSGLLLTRLFDTEVLDSGPGDGGLRGAGRLDTGEALSASAIRRLACDARLIPIVLGGAGVPIDVGRSRRLFTGASRTAIVVRDGGCAFPGCDRPPRWCDVHHVDPWNRGGSTDRDNGVALCGYHHRLIHSNIGWTVRIGPDRRPEFIPPSHVDPTQSPRRNPYHLRT